MQRRMFPFLLIATLVLLSSLVLVNAPQSAALADSPGAVLALQATETATLAPTGSPTVAATATPTSAASATPTATSSQPDLTISTVSANLDPVSAGQILSYFVVVRNAGGSISSQTFLTAQVPTGTSVSQLPSGCAEDPTTRTIRCVVPPLNPGAQNTYSLNYSVTATSGTLTNRFAVDPDSLVAEGDETNNLLDRTINVSPTTPVVAPSATAVATAAPAATAVPQATAQPAPTQAPAPEPTPAPSPEPTTPTEPSTPIEPPAPQQLWLQILIETPVFTNEGDQLGIAQPGDWYAIITQDGGWMLVLRDGDSPEATVWIEFDTRVQLTAF